VKSKPQISCDGTVLLSVGGDSAIADATVADAALMGLFQLLTSATPSSASRDVKVITGGHRDLGGSTRDGKPLSLSPIKIIGDTWGTPKHLKHCETAANDEEQRQVNAATQSPFRMIPL
jgi:hypothetical protein